MNTPIFPVVDQMISLLFFSIAATVSLGRLLVRSFCSIFLLYMESWVDIFTLKSGLLELVDNFTYIRSSISSTENDISTWLAKAWTAIDRLSVIWKSELTDKIKYSFFLPAVVSILLHGCTTRMLTEGKEKKPNGNYIRMLQAVLNKFWKQHTKKQPLYSYLPPITKTIQIQWTRRVRHSRRSKNELISNIPCGPFQMDKKKLDQLEPIYNSSVLIQDVAWKTCRGLRTKETGGERGSRKSWHDDDNDCSFIRFALTSNNQQSKQL